MSLFESVRVALRQVWSQKLKSFFALVGVIIGVMFLIAVIAVVEGMNRYVQTDFAGSIFGVNTIQIHQQRTSGTGSQSAAERRQRQRNPELTLDDVEALAAELPNIWYLAYNSDRYVREVWSGDTRRRNVRLIGATPEYLPLQGWPIEQGRSLTRIDDRRAIRVAVIGHAIADKLFPDGQAIGRELRVGPHRYRIAGVMERQGGMIGTIRDASIVVPFRSYEADFASRRRVVEEISIKFRSQEEMTEGSAAAEEILRRRHALRPEQENDFAIESASEILDAWEQINRILLVSLPGLVGIGLVVGGIVIMNIMLMSVLERTREVGLRKALGARRSDITRQFVAESATLSGLGALMGILVGALLAQLVRAVTPLPASIAPWSILVGAGLGLAVGIIAGVYPAVRAAKMDPVVALRYE